MNYGNLHSGLAVYARTKPDDVAVVFYNESRTFKELYQRVNSLAHSLSHLGIEKGDHVVLYMRNRLEMMEILFALSTIGAVSVPVNYMVEGNGLETLINDSDAKFLFVEEERLDSLTNIGNRLHNVADDNTIVISKSENETSYISYEDLLRGGSIEPPNVEVNSDDMASMLYSSGTTSLPKGIMISQGNQIFRTYSFAVEWGINYKDVVLVTLPIYHSVGHFYMFCLSILGCKMIITRDFNPENTLKLIEDYKVTHSFFVPTQYIMMLELSSFSNYNLSSLRSLVSAGAPLAEVTKKKIIKHFNCDFNEYYGTTEVTPLACLRPDNVLRKSASVGQQLSFMDIRLIDEAGNDVAIGEEGEFAAKGPSMFTEYYKNPEETKKTRTPDGYHRTGDMGIMDNEGFYYLLDRKKDMIISGGVNIYPKDIEEIIYKHPFVLDAAVIGIPDEKWGEKVKAFIVLKHESNLTKQELIDFCNSKLAKYQFIKEVEFIKELPRNPSGKILKRELRNLKESTQ